MKKIKLTAVATLVAASLSTAVLTGCQSTAETSKVAAEQIIKSQNDDREYRYLELDNGLKVVLVSDKEADKAAASMDVHIGHMADPKDREGLTHFLEHMLFLGTAKYPTVGEYGEYLKANGGWSNAGTGQEHTNYFFEVNQDAFNEALDRFAQFFIAPTLDPQYVDREKNAVHSEYSMKIKDDARRIREVLKDTANQAHPASQFSVGNLTTLADRENDLLIDDLKAQYEQYYSASRMALSVVGKEDLDTLESWVKQMFSAIPNNGSKSLPVEVEPYTAEQLGVRINIEAMKDNKTLSLMFPIPSTTQHYKQKPMAFVNTLLSQEGKGSLYSYLKEQGLIESISSYNYGPDDHETFFVNLTLTPKGLEQYQDVTAAVFSYLNLIKQQGLQPLYFDELKTIAKTSFDFQEKGSVANTAQMLSGQLQYYRPEHIINAQYLYEEFSPQLVKEFLSHVTPENMRLVLVAKGLEFNQVQPEYDTQYAMTKLEQAEIAKYKNAPQIAALQLPQANPFIATSLALKDTQDAKVLPQVVFEKPGFKFWHKQDTEFKVPKASVNVQIYSDEAGKDAASRAKNYLYSALLEDSLNEFGYPAKQAGLYYNVWSTKQGLGFGVNGYDQKQTELLTTINKRVRNLTIDPAAFELHKQRLIRNWNNDKFNRPYSQNLSALSRIVENKVYAPEAMANALATVSISDLEQYIAAFHSNIEVEVLAHGNQTESEAKTLANNLYALNLTGSNPRPRTATVVKLNKSAQNLVRELDIDHNDSTVVIRYLSDDDSLNNRAKYALLGTIINAPFYKSMRTDQQLGYIVAGRASSLERLPGLMFLIQSPKAGALELERRINGFIGEFSDTVASMTQAEFDNYKAGLIKDLATKDKNLNERTNTYWGDINAREFNFDSKEKMIAAVEALTLADLQSHYQVVFNQVKPIITRNIGLAHRGEADFKASNSDSSVCRTESCFNGQLKPVIRF